MYGTQCGWRSSDSIVASRNDASASACAAPSNTTFFTTATSPSLRLRTCSTTGKGGQCACTWEAWQQSLHARCLHMVRAEAAQAQSIPGGGPGREHARRTACLPATWGSSSVTHQHAPCACVVAPFPLLQPRRPPPSRTPSPCDQDCCGPRPPDTRTSYCPWLPPHPPCPPSSPTRLVDLAVRALPH